MRAVTALLIAGGIALAVPFVQAEQPAAPAAGVALLDWIAAIG